MDEAADRGHSYWDLSLSERQSLLRYQLAEVLDLVSRGEIGRDDFAQELALDLKRMGDKAVLFRRKRTGFPTPLDTQHHKKFNAVQKNTFFRLIGPYRWKKRQERVIPLTDERWVHDDQVPTGRTTIRHNGQTKVIPDKSRLIRRDDEAKFTGRIPESGNQEELRAAARMDLLRSWERLEREFPEPVIHAALGFITADEARRALRMRKSRVLELIRGAKSLMPQTLRES